MLEMVPVENPGTAHTLTVIKSAYYLFITIAIFRSSVRHPGSRLFIIYAQLTAVGLLISALLGIFGVSLFGSGILP